MRILVVDDKPAVIRALHRALTLDGHQVETASDGAAALTAIALSAPDVIVLDRLMPAPDGLEVCRRVRAAGDATPILMLTARSGVDDRVDGLDAGADDYLTKPFALEELRARLRALARRAAPEQGNVIRVADLTLDLSAHQANRNGRTIELTRMEFLLLELLIRNARRVLTREIILERVWGDTFGVHANTLEVYIGYLRRKTEAEGEARLIRTIRGVGYVIRQA